MSAKTQIRDISRTKTDLDGSEFIVGQDATGPIAGSSFKATVEEVGIAAGDAIFDNATPGTLAPGDEVVVEREGSRFRSDIYEAARDVVNVKAKRFGAVGDGVTDDSVAIRAALAYAATSSRTKAVYFPKGTYIVSLIPGESRCLHIQNPAGQTIFNGLTMFGEYGQSVIKLKNDNYTGLSRILRISGGITGNSLKDVTIRELVVDGDWENSTFTLANATNGITVIHGGTAITENIRIHDVIVRKCNGSNISINASNVHLQNIVSHSTKTRHCIGVSNTDLSADPGTIATNVFLDGIVAYNAGEDDPGEDGHAVDLSSGRNLRMNGFHLYDNDGNGAFKVSSNIEDVSLTNGVIERGNVGINQTGTAADNFVWHMDNITIRDTTGRALRVDNAELLKIGSLRVQDCGVDNDESVVLINAGVKEVNAESIVITGGPENHEPLYCMSPVVNIGSLTVQMADDATPMQFGLTANPQVVNVRGGQISGSTNTTRLAIHSGGSGSSYSYEGVKWSSDKANTSGPRIANGGHLTVKDCDFTDIPRTVGTTNTNSTARFLGKNRGAVHRDSGIAVFDGDGTNTQFTINHAIDVNADGGAAENYQNLLSVIPQTSDAAAPHFVTAAGNGSTIVVTYADAPGAGTGNVAFHWSIERFLRRV